MLDYARVHGWREGENPARWKRHLENIFPKRSKVAAVEHHGPVTSPDGDHGLHNVEKKARAILDRAA